MLLKGGGFEQIMMLKPGSTLMIEEARITGGGGKHSGKSRFALLEGSILANVMSRSYEEGETTTGFELDPELAQSKCQWQDTVRSKSACTDGHVAVSRGEVLLSRGQVRSKLAEGEWSVPEGYQIPKSSGDQIDQDHVPSITVMPPFPVLIRDCDGMSPFEPGFAAACARARGRPPIEVYWRGPIGSGLAEKARGTARFPRGLFACSEPGKSATGSVHTGRKPRTGGGKTSSYAQFGVTKARRRGPPPRDELDEALRARVR